MSAWKFIAMVRSPYFADEWHPVREDVWRVWPRELWVVVDHQAQPVGARALRSNHEKDWK